MRIAVSGTHAMGKSTLAEDFVEKHPEFVLESEPYREDIYGLFSGQQPEVVELWGDRKSRLARLESQIKLI
jgi:deoxyadenosine/deoxycytidine kinase